ncbi:MAG: four helix bundle protein [Nitrospirae bacterium]|nr:four helix bundle protein [Nitrospirota bacterium]
MRKDGKNENNVSDGKHSAHFSHPSHHSDEPDRLLPPRGDYQTLLSFQKAEVVYDLTFRFAHKYLSRGDRTIDQMIQSARSGKKNILEGSKAALTSKETEIKLTNVARASLEELLDDYKDYLRARDLKIWDKDSKEAQYVRSLGRKTPQTYEDYREFVESRPPEVIANIALCLIHQTNYLIDQQLRRLEKDFLEQGGLRERMTRARLRYRNRNSAPYESQDGHRPPPRKPGGRP